ncbi:hypothetical protein [Brevibacillus formosus]
MAAILMLAAASTTLTGLSILDSVSKHLWKPAIIDDVTQPLKTK